MLVATLKSFLFVNKTSKDLEISSNCSSLRVQPLTITFLFFIKVIKSISFSVLPALSLTVKLSLYALYNLSRLYEYVTVELSVAFESAVADEPEITLSPFFTVIVSNGKPLVGA